MILHRTLLFVVLPLVSSEIAEVTSGIRRKRILLGHEAATKYRDAYYPTFRYYVFLAKEAFPGQIDESPSWWQKLAKAGLSPTVMMTQCGGSLLTPSIVQTACHCLAKYTRKRQDNFTYALPLNVWEDRIYPYFASNKVKEMYYMLIPKHYIIYQACRKVTASGANLFDFGLIVSKESIATKAPDAEISYAPVYKGADIREFYYATIQKEYTCLFIGHGLWDVTSFDNGVPQVVREPSQLIQWGWRSIMNYVDCLAASYSPTDRQIYFFNYTRHVSWACARSQTKNKYLYLAMEGDSGGPVSCNNVYFAILSFQSLLTAQNILTFSSPIAHTSFENAAEYRDNFVTFCKQFGNDDPDILDSPATHPPNPYQPTPPPVVLSRCPPKISLHRLNMILSSTLFTWLSYPLPMYRI